MPKSPAALLTPGQWLARSFGWAMSCLGGWLLLISLLYLSLQNALAQHDTLKWSLVFGVSAVAHGALWWNALAGDWLPQPGLSGWLLEIAARFWLVVLTLFQISSLGLLLGALSMLLGWDTGGDWGNPNTH